MKLELLVASAVIAIGVLFAVAEEEICRNDCWLDSMVDAVLPAQFDTASGGVPWVVIGALLFILALRK
jgi:hypothetical protein